MNSLLLALAALLAVAASGPSGWAEYPTAEEALWQAKSFVARAKAAEQLAIFKAKELAENAKAEAAREEALWKSRNEEALAEAKAADEDALQRVKNAEDLEKAKAAEEEALGKAKQAADEARAKAAADEEAFKARNEETLAKAKAAEDEAIWRANILAEREEEARKAAEEAALWNAKNAALLRASLASGWSNDPWNVLPSGYLADTHTRSKHYGVHHQHTGWH